MTKTRTRRLEKVSTLTRRCISISTPAATIGVVIGRDTSEKFASSAYQLRKKRGPLGFALEMLAQGVKYRVEKIADLLDPNWRLSPEYTRQLGWTRAISKLLRR